MIITPPPQSLVFEPVSFVLKDQLMVVKSAANAKCETLAWVSYSLDDTLHSSGGASKYGTSCKHNQKYHGYILYFPLRNVWTWLRYTLVLFAIIWFQAFGGVWKLFVLNGFVLGVSDVRVWVSCHSVRSASSRRITGTTGTALDVVDVPAVLRKRPASQSPYHVESCVATIMSTLMADW